MDLFRNLNIKIGLLILLILGTVLLVNILELDFYLIRWLENGIYNLLSPFFNAINGTTNYINGVYQSFFESRELLEENQRLKQKLAKQTMINDSYVEIIQENERLRNLYDFEAFTLEELNLVGARATGVSPSSWEQRILINKGSNDSLKERQPVLGYNGYLLGRLINTGVSSSQVMLANDPEFSVGGRVQRPESRAIGVIRGQPGERNRLLMERISWDADIQVGDLIVTTGVSKDYPRGIPIGVVEEVFPANFGLSQSAYIEYDFGKRTTEELLIIIDY
ncbi:MAG: rod shape-determining protein MreC [Bacillota bacterium]